MSADQPQSTDARDESGAHPPSADPAATRYSDPTPVHPADPDATRYVGLGANSGTATPAVPGYEILSELGRGGMGVVYKARQTKLNRVVALKMILVGAHAGPEDLQRFRSEAEAVARLQHPNIVQIFEVGEIGALPFFSLEFCGGGGLDKKLAGTPMPPKEAATLVEELARAMQAAHDKGVIHRDLKPGNVLLTEDGTPKITDFGLAKKLDADAGQTRTGAIMGTASYMPPEQASGAMKYATFTTDVYGLGAILYTTLVGEPPFSGADWMDVLVQVRTHPVVPPSHRLPGIPAALEGICLKCLEKEPRRRYATAGEMSEDLRRFLAGEPTEAADGPAFPSSAPEGASDEAAIGPAGATSGVSDVPRAPLGGGRARFPAIPGYEVLGELGRGALSVVYKARQTRVNRIVAVKLIQAGDHADEQTQARLRAEGEAVAQLQHPNIVQLYDLGEHTGLVYMVMEYVEGSRLDRLMKGEPQPPRASAELVEEVAQAVGFAHQRGFIHQDVRPANVLLVAPSKPDGKDSPRGRELAKHLYGFPKITDFGLARRLGRENAEKEGAVLGCPSYMSPERAWGRNSEVGPASDVWGLGAMLYEMLTGRPPFCGQTILDTLMAVIKCEAAPPSKLVKVPGDLEAICLKCLHKDPARRYATGEELADDLRRFRGGRACLARPMGFWGRMFFRHK